MTEREFKPATALSFFFFFPFLISFTVLPKTSFLEPPSAPIWPGCSLVQSCSRGTSLLVVLGIPVTFCWLSPPAPILRPLPHLCGTWELSFLSFPGILWAHQLLPSSPCRHFSLDPLLPASSLQSLHVISVFKSCVVQSSRWLLGYEATVCIPVWFGVHFFLFFFFQLFEGDFQKTIFASLKPEVSNFHKAMVKYLLAKWKYMNNDHFNTGRGRKTKPCPKP